MSRIKLESLTVQIPDPESNLLDQVIQNQKQQLEYAKDSKSFTPQSKIRSLSKEIQEKKSAIKDLKKEVDILKNWRVQLNPYVDPLELVSLFDKRKMTIPADIAQGSKKFEFFELTFGGAIFIQEMNVKKLEIGIVFDPDLKREERHSIAYSIFPTNEWQKFGKLSLVFGLSGDLGFKVPLKADGLPFAKIGDLEPKVQAEFLLGPFVYVFKKAAIRGVGKGNFLINWIIEKKDFLEEGDFETRVVLKVPKGRNLVRAKVALRATVSIPGFLKRILGKTREMAPDVKVYDIALV
jgi:hypothetical protein